MVRRCHRPPRLTGRRGETSRAEAPGPLAPIGMNHHIDHFGPCRIPPTADVAARPGVIVTKPSFLRRPGQGGDRGPPFRPIRLGRAASRRVADLPHGPNRDGPSDGPPSYRASWRIADFTGIKPPGERKAGWHQRAADQGIADRSAVCPPVRGHPLSFLNDLSRPTIGSNPRVVGPSCRVPRLPAPLLDTQVPLRGFALSVEPPSWPS